MTLNYAMMDGDQLAWIMDNRTKSIERFQKEGKPWSLLVEFISMSDKVAANIQFDSIKQEYDLLSKEFVPYRPYYYAVLNKNRTIGIMTFYKPEGELKSSYTCIPRHMAEYYYRQSLPVNYNDMLTF
jgi:hypothetical protein